MGNTLPTVQDVGRVQLRSSRVDIPGQGEMAVANSLANAAATFTQMAIDHKNKDDALSYSNAKNEYLVADIQEREKLADDQDFASHGERYRVAMKGHYERLFPTVRSARDQHLFDSEARLMDARGTVAVGENSRVKEIDWNLGQFNKNLQTAQGVIMAAGDAQTAQDAMFTVLEQGAALRERGYLSEEEYQLKMQTFVSDTAFKRLTAMDPKQREVLLERSITMTKTKGEPITRDQIQNGEGSDSIADFLPLDVRVKMLDETRKGNEHDDTMDAAYGIFDAVRSRHVDPGKVAAAARVAGEGQPSDVRSALRTLTTQYRQDIKAEEDAEIADIMLAGSELALNKINPETMPGQQWGKLQGFQKAALKDQFNAAMTDREFGEFNVWDRPIGEDGMSYSLWMSIPRDQKPAVTLEDPAWKMSFTATQWAALKKEQESIVADQAKPDKATPRTPGPTPMQRVNAALVRDGTIPQTGRTNDDNELYWSTVANYHNAIAYAEEVKNGRLTTEEEELVFSRMMQDKAFTDSFWDWTGGAGTDDSKKKAIASMSPSVLDKAREPLIGQKTSVGGVPMTHREKLRQMATDISLAPDDVSENDLERANFAMINLIGTEGQRYTMQTITPAQMADVDLEIERRLRGK